MKYNYYKIYPLSFCFVTIFSPIFSTNILFLFGGGNLSHKISIWPFVIGLAEAGHNVTFTSSSDKQLRSHPRVKDVTPASFLEFTQKLFTPVSRRLEDRKQGKQLDVTGYSYHYATANFCIVTFDAYNNDPTFRKLFQKDVVDLVIVNSAYNDCSLYLAHFLGVKFILFSSSIIMPWFHGTFGAPIETSSIPDMTAKLAYPPTFLDRMWNVYKYYKGYSRPNYFTSELEMIYQEKIKPEIPIPPILEIERNASLVFLNSHHSIDMARSLPPIFVNIGGMQCWDEVKELPANFREFMDSADEGVVLITFGSTINLSSLDEKHINIFLNTMKKFKRVNFIWKWDGSLPKNSPANLMASNWLPQREILNHPKTIAFMTHGGLNSINEATYHGVPLIVCPLFADQDFNAYRIRAQKLGISVELLELTQEMLDSAVGDVIGNKEYKRNMMVRSAIFRDRIRTPVEEAVSWAEFVLRQDDTSALKPMLLDQPWCVRTSLDVFVSFAIIFTAIPLFLIYIISHFVKLTFKY